jgi:hypothetical protein
LTLREAPLKSNRKVFHFQPNSYADWRARLLASTALCEGGNSTVPSEKLLQQIWYHQRLLRDQLATVDGRTVRVLHPGFWNHESGPDFLGAVIQIGSDAPKVGDVEIDLRAQGWRSHGHFRNPAFRRVLLHVIWEEEAGEHLPLLSLKSRLDSPLAELEYWLGQEALAIPEPILGNCCGPLRNLSSEAVKEILRQAAEIRLRSKAALFQARAKQLGADGALREGLFAALGYKHNVWPMQRLAHLAGEMSRGQPKATPFEWQARLLGLSGLLPADLPGRSRGSGAYVRRVWDLWWRERESWCDSSLPKQTWRLDGIRPANHPQRRLALAAHWLATDGFHERIEQWFTTELPKSKWEAALLAVFQSAKDEFWSWHWTLNSKKLSKAQPLLGETRLTDIAVNVILPWFWMRAVAGKNDALRVRAEQRYYEWRPAQDNAVLRLARLRLFGGRAPHLHTAAEQQGILQIVRDFCQHSNALCEQCEFPKLVREFGA